MAYLPPGFGNMAMLPRQQQMPVIPKLQPGQSAYTADMFKGNDPYSMLYRQLLARPAAPAAGPPGPTIDPNIAAQFAGIRNALGGSAGGTPGVAPGGGGTPGAGGGGGTLGNWQPVVEQLRQRLAAGWGGAGGQPGFSQFMGG